MSCDSYLVPPNNVFDTEKEVLDHFLRAGVMQRYRDGFFQTRLSPGAVRVFTSVQSAVAYLVREKRCNTISFMWAKFLRGE